MGELVALANEEVFPPLLFLKNEDCLLVTLRGF